MGMEFNASPNGGDDSTVLGGVVEMKESDEAKNGDDAGKE